MRINILFGLFLFLSCLSFAVDVNGCETLNNASVNYILTTDISIVSGSCLYIAASNITLDCAGNSITAPAWDIIVGTSTASYSNITIQNCELLGNGGIYLINGYRYGYGDVGYTKDVIINNTINVFGGGIYTYYGKDMNITNNTINIVSGRGIYDWGSIMHGGINHYDHNTINIVSGEAISKLYGGYISITYSNITALNGVAIYDYSNYGGSTAVSYSRINASVGSFSSSSHAPIFRNTDIYVNQTGFLASWADFGFLYDSQVIASGSAHALMCDNVAYWPYYAFWANNTNITSVNASAILNGNPVYGIACSAIINHSYVYSQYDDALNDYGGTATTLKKHYENSVFVANAPLKSAIINHNDAEVSYFRNITLYSNTSVGGFELQDLAHNNAVYRNITLNGTGHATSFDFVGMTPTGHAAYASARLPFNSTNSSGLYLNISSPIGNLVGIDFYYFNDTPYNLTEWKIYRWDGINLTIPTQGKNTSMKWIYVGNDFDTADSYIFALLGNATMINGTITIGTCEYYGNCTIGTACVLDSDCASGMCFQGHCIDNGGCVGDGCSIFPNFIDVIMILFGDASTAKFLFALIFICAAAAVGFKYAGQAGALICATIMMLVLAVLPDPLISWWIVIIVLICGGVAMLYSRNQGVN